MPTVLTATKLRNQIHKLDPFLTVDLKNIRVNGALLGCSGFVSDGTRWVYVSTDHNHGTGLVSPIQLATGAKDYSGGTTRYADYGDLAGAVVSTLKG